jgi:hypothetical protein
LVRGKFGHALHSPHSPDLYQCDFWLWGFLKKCMKALELSTKIIFASYIRFESWSNDTCTPWQWPRKMLLLTACNPSSKNGCRD